MQQLVDFKAATIPTHVLTMKCAAMMSKTVETFALIHATMTQIIVQETTMKTNVNFIRLRSTAKAFVDCAKENTNPQCARKFNSISIIVKLTI